MEKLPTRLFLVCLVCLFISSIGIAQSPTNLEKELLQFFVKNDFDVSNLNPTTSGTEIISEGTTSFLGISNVQLLVVQNAANSQLKKITANFPASANLDLSKLSKFSDGNLARLIPSSLTQSLSLYINDFVMDIADDGKSISTCELNFTGNNWDVIGFGDFLFDELSLKIFKNAGDYGGTLSSKSNIGSVAFETLYTLSSEEKVVISGSVSQSVSIDDIISTLGGTYAESFWGLFPNDKIKQVGVENIEYIMYPLERFIIVKGMSSAGAIALQFRQSGSKRNIAVEASPTTLEEIVGSSFLDALNFESPLIVMSNYVDRDCQSQLIPENISMNISKGLNVMSNVNLGQDFENIFKMSHVYFSGAIGKSKNFKFLGATNNDIPLGTSKIRFKGLNFKIESESTPVKPPSIGMGGVLNLEISSDESLDFIADLETQIAPVQIGGQIELDVKDGSGIWKNPFGIPCLGIKNLIGGVSLSPAIPTIISELVLGGDLMIAKKFDGSYTPVYGKLNTKLSVTDPWSSNFDGHVKQLSIVGLLEAISDVKLTGEIRNILSSGIDSADIEINPREHRFSASGSFNMFGINSSISIGMNELNVFAKGTMDPFEINVDDFTIFGIYGMSDHNPSFHIQLGTNPIMKIDGRITVLESMEAGAFIDISSTGFHIIAEGKIFNGAFSGDLEAWGTNLKSSSPSIYAELKLSQSIVSSMQNQLTQWVDQNGSESSNEIKNLENELGAIGNIASVAANQIKDAFNKMSVEAATLGVLITKNMMPDIREINFVGNLDKSNATMRFGIVVALGSEKMNLSVDFNMKGDLQSQLNQIVKEIQNQILSQFKYLGEEIKRKAEEAGEFIVGVAKDGIEWAEDRGEDIIEVVKVLDEAWNGKDLPAPFNGEQLSQIPIDFRHYEIQLAGIRCLIADDKALLGNAALETYGAIYFIPSNMTTSRNTNDIVYSKNRTEGKHNLFSSGTYKNLGSTKHFYVLDGQVHGITIKIDLLDSDQGGSVDLDDHFRGHAYINLTAWPWGQESPKKIMVSGTGGTYEISYKIKLHKQIEENDFLLAIDHGSTDEVTNLIKKGGNISRGCLLTRAIQKRDANMVNFLIANNATICPNDISIAFSPNYFSEPVAITTLLMYNGAINNGILDQAIALNNLSTTELLIIRGLQPNNSHLTQALNNKNVSLVKLLLMNKVPATQENLNFAINNNLKDFVLMIIDSGVIPTTVQLNTAIDKNYSDIVTELLKSVKPNNESYVKAATKNDTECFRMLTRSNVRISDYRSANIAIEKKNLDILQMALDMGSSADQALTSAIKVNYMEAVIECLDKGARTNPALEYAIKQNNNNLFTSLITDYGADPNKALDYAFNNSKIEYAEIALSMEAEPNSQMIKQANAGKEANVKLLVEAGANPTMGVSGAVRNNQPQLLDYLIEKGAVTNLPIDLVTAVEKSSLQMVKSLVNNGSNPQRGIFMAVQMKNPEIMVFLFESGASPNGFIAKASAEGELKIVQILLDYGAKPTEGIKMAIDNNKMDVAELLLESGADPTGMLPKATSYASVKIVGMLLERGENPNDGVIIAVRNNLTEVALVILSYNPSTEGLIPIASGLGNDRIVAKLLEMGADPQRGISAAVGHNKMSTAKLLLVHGADVSSGEFVTIAVNTKNVHMVKLMIDNGSDYTIIDSNGKSLLHNAAALGSQYEILKLLLDLNLDPNLKNNAGDSPLHIAVLVKGKENLPAVEALHRGGADLNLPNAKGKLPLKIAKNKKVRKYLKENDAVKKPGK